MKLEYLIIGILIEKDQVKAKYQSVHSFFKIIFSTFALF